MKLIKTVSFEVIENFSEILFQKTNKTSLDDVRKKVSSYLVQSGANKFIALYNEVVSNKDYFKALDVLKIE